MPAKRDNPLTLVPQSSPLDGWPLDDTVGSRALWRRTFHGSWKHFEDMMQVSLQKLNAKRKMEGNWKCGCKSDPIWIYLWIWLTQYNFPKFLQFVSLTAPAPQERIVNPPNANASSCRHANFTQRTMCPKRNHCLVNWCGCDALDWQKSWITHKRFCLRHVQMSFSHVHLKTQTPPNSPPGWR